jgi:pimeloyl-ACP methyl ester carboxylesterase
MEPIILIHGALGCGPQVAPLQALLSANRDVRVLELEGHGQTPSELNQYSIERFAQNLRDFMAAEAIDRASLFGYSMGGYVALYVAAEQPEMVTSIVTLGTKLAWTPDSAARETSRLDPATIRAKVPKFADQLERRHTGAGGWELVLAKTASLMTQLGSRPIVDAALLGRIQHPVRLMVGDRDAVVSVDETIAAMRGMRRAELAVLPSTPHPLEQVRMPLIASMVRDFIDAT